MTTLSFNIETTVRNVLQEIKFTHVVFKMPTYRLHNPNDPPCLRVISAYNSVFYEYDGSCKKTNEEPSRTRRDRMRYVDSILCQSRLGEGFAVFANTEADEHNTFRVATNTPLNTRDRIWDFLFRV